MAKWWKNILRPFDDDEDDYGGYTPSTPEPPNTPRPTVTTAPRSGSQYASSYDESAQRNKVATIHATAQLQIVLVNPEKFDNAAEIAEHLRERRTVILNLDQTNKDLARRLLDFLGGVAYAQDGRVKRLSVNTYLITPYNVDIVDDLVEELENNGLYF